MLPRSFQKFSGLSSWSFLVLLAGCLLSARVEGYQDVSSTSWSSTAYEWGLFGGYPQQSFKSSSLRPPRMNTVQWDEQCAQGYTVLSLRGTKVDPKPAGIIVDGRGELVWMDEDFGYVMNLKVQEYKGKRYLTFWSGKFGDGFGLGSYYMLDSHYEVYKQFSASNTRENDFHEYTITSDDTALLTSYEITSADLSALGVEGQGWIYDSMFREIDIETGDLIFEWRASNHFAINDTFYSMGSAGRSPDHPFDFFHINSVDKDEEGNYIVSSRFLHSIACISGSTGEILWTLGGRNNDFEDLSEGSAIDFAWQHHVSVQGKNQLSIFDNAKWKKWYTELYDHGEVSRGMLVSLDTENMTVELTQEYINPSMRGSPQQGSMQVLDSGNVLLGWGYYAAYTEFAPDGKLLCDTHIIPSIAFPYGFAHSYRAFRAKHWVGRPNTQPDVYLNPNDGVAYVSWLGATEVYEWALQIADSASPSDDLVFTNGATAAKVGFETQIELPEGDYKYLCIVALDRNGNELGVSKIISAQKGTVTGFGRYALAIAAGVWLGVCFVMCLFFQKRLRALVSIGKQKLRRNTWVRKWQDHRRTGTAKYEGEEERLYNG